MMEVTMRTTLNLDDQLIDAAKHRAIENRVSLAQVVENALRESLSKPSEPHETIRLVTAPGIGVKHGVNLDDSRALLDIMSHSQKS